MLYGPPTTPGRPGRDGDATPSRFRPDASRGLPLDLGAFPLSSSLEPWVATAFFLALETASKGKYKETKDPQHLLVIRETREKAFAFQAKVREELTTANPARMKDLPDGLLIYNYAFKPGRYPVPDSQQKPKFDLIPKRRVLPDGVH